MVQMEGKKATVVFALKNLRKKHSKEISELNAKLEFLRDENDLLAQKLD
jgi:hypothetical protein